MNSTELVAKDYGLFDILGPVMIGPSSSHTAGACRIGLMARQIFGETPKKIDIMFHRSLMKTFKGHCTDVGFVAGLLNIKADDPRLRQSLALAAEAGIEIDIKTHPDKDIHPNTIWCSLVGDKYPSPMIIEGISTGGGNILMTGVNGQKINLNGQNEISIYLGAMPNEDRSESDLAIPVEGIAPVIRKIKPIMEFTKKKHVTPLSMVDLQVENPVDKIITYESERSGKNKEQVWRGMENIHIAMVDSAKESLSNSLNLVGGLVSGRDGQKLWLQAIKKKTVCNGIMAKAIALSIAIGEYNAAMGRVVAAPTAGSCGVIPAVLLILAEHLEAEEKKVIEALFVAAGVGVALGRYTSFSGAVGGCQAEIGASAAMAAAAAVYLAGGNGIKCSHAMAIALKNSLGLACDPAASPVEIPCIKRNALGVSTALGSSELAFAGVQSYIPPDEVILALRNVEDIMPEDLRDNTLGGLGSTPTSKEMKRICEKKFCYQKPSISRD